MSITSTVSPTVRSRGRGKTTTERARSRAAFKAWDTRREQLAFERRSRAAKKAARTRTTANKRTSSSR